jgi:hypothetical protein
MKHLAMKNISVRVAISLLWIFACIPVHADMELTAQQRENLGIKTAALTKTEVGKTFLATAQVLDATPLVTLLSDLRAAQSTAAASNSEFERAKELHAAEATVSLKAVEAARAQSVADTGHVNALRAQLVSAWGTAVVAMPESEREHLVADLLASRASLLRAELRQDQNDTPQFKQARVRLLTQQQMWPAQVLGLAALTTAQSMGRAYLLRVGATPLQPGQVLAVELIDPRKAVSGIKVPRSAIVRWQGSTWVFIEAESKFTRHMIHPIEWLDDGCLVQEDLQAGQSIVTVGASMLLAAESTGAE